MDINEFLSNSDQQDKTLNDELAQASRRLSQSNINAELESKRWESTESLIRLNHLLSKKQEASNNITVQVDSPNNFVWLKFFGWLLTFAIAVIALMFQAGLLQPFTK